MLMNTVIDEALENEHEIDAEDESDWQVEADLRTLVEARRIMKDPERLARVRAFLQAGVESVRL